MQRELLDIQRRVLGPEHPDTLMTRNDLVVTLAKEGRYAESGKSFRELLDIQGRVLGPEHPDTANSIYNLGCMAALQGRRDEAFSLLREAVDHGYSPSADLGIDKDPDLQSLHGDPRFTALVAHAKEKAAATRMPQ
jgi:Flp pilus assembly protein TadD